MSTTPNPPSQLDPPPRPYSIARRSINATLSGTTNMSQADLASRTLHPILRSWAQDQIARARAAHRTAHIRGEWPEYPYLRQRQSVGLHRQVLPTPQLSLLGGGTDDDNDDTNIWCSKCGQPVGACHCDALPMLARTHQLAVPSPSGQSAEDDISILTPIPARGADGKGTIVGYVIHNLTQDTTDEEEEDKTLISTSGGIDDEDAKDAVTAVVPDGVGGGGSRPAYNGGNRG